MPVFRSKPRAGCAAGRAHYTFAMTPTQAVKPALTHLLYLHGFRSSPLSSKAQHTARWVALHRPDLQFWCPQLPPSPTEALALLRAGMADWPKSSMAVIGSSLGGFYATVLAEGLACPAVLFNPAVDPARDLTAHIGRQTTWQDPAEAFFFRAEYIAELRAMATGPLRDPAGYGVVIAKGDEVLDWREMQARYQGAEILLLEGSDHALSEFDGPFDFMLDFLAIAPAAPAAARGTPATR